LVVATDGQTVRIGKRKAWLADDEPFFGWQLLRSDLEAPVRSIHSELGGAGIIRLFGELFGGGYPHPEVAPSPGASPVQTGIWYAPDVRFAAFDLLIEESPDSSGVFLSHRELEDLPGDLFVVPVLARGTKADLEKVPFRFASRVATSLGLPAIEANWAEGLVLKPDSRLAPDDRPVVKRKIPEFDEQRFDDSAPWNPDARLSRRELETLGAKLLNPARVASARSKVGDADPAALRDEIVLDVMVDLEAAFPSAMRALTPEDEEALRGFLGMV